MILGGITTTQLSCPWLCWHDCSKGGDVCRMQGTSTSRLMPRARAPGFRSRGRQWIPLNPPSTTSARRCGRVVRARIDPAGWDGSDLLAGRQARPDRRWGAWPEGSWPPQRPGLGRGGEEPPRRRSQAPVRKANEGATVQRRRFAAHPIHRHPPWGGARDWARRLRPVESQTRPLLLLPHGLGFRARIRSFLPVPCGCPCLFLFPLAVEQAGFSGC